MIARTVCAAWVKGTAQLFQAEGLDADAVFIDAGLDMNALSKPEVRFAPDEISLLWEIAVARSGNPALGLAVEPSATPPSFDEIAYVMMSSSTLRTALANMVEYTLVVSNAAEILLHEDSGGLSVTMSVVGNERPVPRQRIEFMLITILNFCRWLTGRDLRPLAADFTSPEPSEMQAYLQAFRCPMHFNAPIHRLLFAREDVDQPLPTYNPKLAEVHQRYVSEHQHRLENSSFSFKARGFIIPKLSGGDLQRGEVAKAMHMSERTLQRRLQEEGTSFQQLVDDIRRELARDYLSENKVTLRQTAFLLGFSDQSTFFRACKRWFEMSPGEYRTHFDLVRARAGDA
ncbi:MAG TPA: AraC family transcriptional regulator [Paraburkholderia sp.]|uniref:AraC family transcriptional regulator n=1 Tax=Paraburkholderia sp. TaxID=1926495 RepID=UPI002B45B9CD|nr:AraC family transcriptional regulator [Paraburkholderia sp.]HKR40407.1 AraC family transcriptional regulator [Paraburkholderia sp.]